LVTVDGELRRRWRWIVDRSARCRLLRPRRALRRSPCQKSPASGRRGGDFRSGRAPHRCGAGMSERPFASAAELLIQADVGRPAHWPQVQVLWSAGRHQSPTGI